MSYRKYCLYCNKEIPRKRPRDKEKRFCDRSCSAKYLFAAPKINCKKCGKIISSAKGRKFCSRRCANSYRTSSYNKKCPVCKKLFVLHNRAYEKRGSGIYCSIKCRGKASRKHRVNENFFTQINSESKAYWLGFLYADGYQSGKEITINLKHTDLKHLEKFKKSIEATYPVVIKRNVKSNGHISHTASIRIYSPKLCDNLDKKGCTKKKSLTLIYPEFIPQRYERHFIRGYFDGDGSFSIDPNRKNCARLTFYSGSICFVDGLEKALLDEGFTLNRGKKNPRFLTANRRDLLYSLYRYLYAYSKIWLERKRDLFIEYIAKGK